jgi:hypothetical protein
MLQKACTFLNRSALAPLQISHAHCARTSCMAAALQAPHILYMTSTRVVEPCIRAQRFCSLSHSGGFQSTMTKLRAMETAFCFTSTTAREFRPGGRSHWCAHTYHTVPLAFCASIPQWDKMPLHQLAPSRQLKTRYVEQDDKRSPAQDADD